jgi:hypothetical protein
VPVFDAVVDIRHDGRTRSSLAVLSGGAIVWKAVFDGTWDSLEVDGAPRIAWLGTDDAGRPVSWVTAEAAPGSRVVVSVPASR